MKRSALVVLASTSTLLALYGCQSYRDDGEADSQVTVLVDDEADNGDGDGDGDSSAGTTNDGETGGCPPITGCLDQPAEEDPVGCDDEGNCNLIDLLFVIDNSGTMGEEQLNLAKNFPLLIQQLEGLKDEMGMPIGANVNIMVTTSDFGNPLCKPFATHEPEQGAPVATACTQRIERFTGIAQINPPKYEEACTDVCAEPGLEPIDGDLIIHFDPEGDNVPPVPPVDINGDGIDDSAVAQTLACIGPQGIDGCGYEAQLESMMQALDPLASWNCGSPDDPVACPNGGVARPFMREGAVLAIAMVTDEVDCSVSDYAVMSDEDFFAELDGQPLPSSALCWKAGVTCNGPDANGVYVNCSPDDSAEMLHPVSRYTDFLNGYIREGLGKEVVMLGILGVPPVTKHADDPPHEPVEGGVEALVYRKWKPGIYPNGDILPADDAKGIDADYQQWAFGIGPGCTGEDAMGNVTGQAIPPVRIRHVCESLNYDNRVRCCIESVCDDDFSAAIGCLTDVLQEVFVPVG